MTGVVLTPLSLIAQIKFLVSAVTSMVFLVWVTIMLWHNHQFYQNYVTRKIIKFINGKNFGLALTCNGLLGWGVNDHGQLVELVETDYIKICAFLKPSRIKFFNDKPIDDVCVGSGHVLVLLKNSLVFSWGHNKYGEVGTGVSDAMVTFPTELKIFQNITVKTIYIVPSIYHLLWPLMARFTVGVVIIGINLVMISAWNKL